MTDEPYEYQHIVHNYGPRLPVEEYVEIGADGWEVRKVEVFEDGHLTFGDDVLYTGRTGLSELKALSIDALNAMTRVTARVITAAEFERAWERAHAEPFTVRRLG